MRTLAPTKLSFLPLPSGTELTANGFDTSNILPSSFDAGRLLRGNSEHSIFLAFDFNELST
jgi:hypothetical protein